MTPLTVHRRRPAGWAAAMVLVPALMALWVAGVAGAATQTTTSARHLGPGTAGSVAAISGTSMEVQSAATGQTTVDWTSSTTFTQTATVSKSSVTAGDCVTVTGTSSKKTITAKTVAISTPSSSGTCTDTEGPAGFAGEPGGGSTTFRPPSGAGGTVHRGTFPGGSKTHRTFPGAGDLGFASGKVTAVGSKTLTISGFSSASIAKSDGKSAKKSTKSSSKSKGVTDPKTTTVHVDVGSSTTYSETETATATNLAVGDCVTASGTTASNGTVSASTIRITSTGGSSCTGGFTEIGGGGTATGA
jgi:hypothetical protein